MGVGSGREKQIPRDLFFCSLIKAERQREGDMDGGVVGCPLIPVSTMTGEVLRPLPKRMPFQRDMQTRALSD